MLSEVRPALPCGRNDWKGGTRGLPGAGRGWLMDGRAGYGDVPFVKTP